MLTLTLPHLKRYLRICDILRCLPLHWDNKCQGIAPIKPQRRILAYKLGFILQVLYAIILSASILFNKSPSFTLEKKIQGIFFVNMWIESLAVQTDREPYDFVNTLLYFEKKLLAGINYKKSMVDKGLTVFLPVCQVCSIGIPLMSTAILAVQPCQPPFLLSMTSFCTDIDGPPPHWALRIPVLLGEAWTFLVVVNGGGFFGIYVLYMGISSLSNYLHLLSLEVLKPKNLDPCNHHCLKRYQILQLISTLLNDCVRWRLFPVIMVALPGLQILSMLVLIKLHGVIPLASYAMFPVTLVDAIMVNIVIQTVTSKIFTESNAILLNLRRLKSGQNGFLRKKLKSLMCLKVQFGDNFIDQLTPLVIQDFCFSQTTTLLLLSE